MRLIRPILLLYLALIIFAVYGLICSEYKNWENIVLIVGGLIMVFFLFKDIFHGGNKSGAIINPT